MVEWWFFPPFHVVFGSGSGGWETRDETPIGLILVVKIVACFTLGLLIRCTICNGSLEKGEGGGGGRSPMNVF